MFRTFAPIGRVILCSLALHETLGRVKRNPDFVGTPPERTPMSCDDAEVRDALRYVMTELRRLSNTYRYASLEHCHGAESSAANFDGRNVFLDVEFDMLRGQLSRHDLIVFKDDEGKVSGMAIDEFPDVKFREVKDPDV
uniref:Uncharacterized protein n=1 Tax=Coccolithus braarudii TaxID=221442 RepID=A0A7S0Q5B3_9EUKA|mmetsp:Transcript_36211/g.77222  ORF Transcript_36211/g.77222 Transcript_36211/m.77222 type:complete len:139 (+) Transcript_36211:68-484(+)